MKTIEQYGIQPGMEVGLIKRIVLANRLSIALALLVPFYGLLFFLLGIKAKFYSYSLIAVLAHLLVLWMNSQSWINFSRFWMIFISSVAVVHFSLLFGKETHAHYILLGLASMSFVLFQFKEISKLIPGFLFPLVLFLAIEIPAELTLFKIDLEPRAHTLVRIIAGISALIAQIVPVIYLYRSNAREIHNNKEIYKQYIHAAKLAALGEMAGGVSHEINNPLAVLMLSSERLKRQVLKSPPDPAVLLDTSERIKSNVERISTIVSGLREMSHDSSSEPFMQVNPVEIIATTINMCKERFKENGVDLTYELDDQSMTIMGRSSQLAQVLLVLLNNSYDAVVENNWKWVRIKLLRLPRRVEIRIIDSGPGIQSDIADKVFQPFFTTKAIGKGVGLNLSIARSAVEEHMGELRIDPLEKNTTFVVSLPLHGAIQKK